MRCDEPVAIHLPGTVEAGWAGFLVRPRDYQRLSSPHSTEEDSETREATEQGLSVLCAQGHIIGLGSKSRPQPMLTCGICYLI